MYFYTHTFSMAINLPHGNCRSASSSVGSRLVAAGDCWARSWNQGLPTGPRPRDRQAAESLESSLCPWPRDLEGRLVEAD